MSSRGSTGGRRGVVVLLALLAALGAALSGWAPRATAATTFTATLNGANQVPANLSTATGSATVVLSDDQTMITVNVTFSGLTGGIASAAHIHGPAPPGMNANVLFPFSNFPAATSGTFQQTFAITAAQVAELQAGSYYVNIHNATFPGGEIRGQLGLASTAVTFRSLDVVRSSSGVLVRWRTASELDLLGFNVYRGVHGQRVRVNARLIRAHGRGAYTFLDRMASRNRVAQYWVQAVSLDGSRSSFGPAKSSTPRSAVR